MRAVVSAVDSHLDLLVNELDTRMIWWHHVCINLEEKNAGEGNVTSTASATFALHPLPDQLKGADTVFSLARSKSTRPSPFPTPEKAGGKAFSVYVW